MGRARVASGNGGVLNLRSPDGVTRGLMGVLNRTGIINLRDGTDADRIIIGVDQNGGYYNRN